MTLTALYHGTFDLKFMFENLLITENLCFTSLTHFSKSRLLVTKGEEV